MISKSIQNMMKRWRATQVLRDRGITHLNTPEYYELVAQEVKKLEEDPIVNIMTLAREARFKVERADLDDGDAVRIEFKK